MRPGLGPVHNPFTMANIDEHPWQTMGKWKLLNVFSLVDAFQLRKELKCSKPSKVRKKHISLSKPLLQRYYERLIVLRIRISTRFSIFVLLICSFFILFFFHRCISSSWHNETDLWLASVQSVRSVDVRLVPRLEKLKCILSVRFAAQTSR